MIMLYIFHTALWLSFWDLVLPVQFAVHRTIESSVAELGLSLR